LLLPKHLSLQQLATEVTIFSAPVRLSVRHTGGSVKDGWSQDHAPFTTE